MKNVSLRFTGALVLSIVFAFVFMLIPIREEWLFWRPEWVALTLIHWGLVSPKNASLLVAWITGLLFDAMYGSTLGQHALGFTIVLFMTLRMRPRMLVDGLFQQLFLLLVVLGTYLLINLWILGFTGNTPGGWGYWFTVLSSVGVWPLYHYHLQIYHGKKKANEY